MSVFVGSSSKAREAATSLEGAYEIRREIRPDLHSVGSRSTSDDVEFTLHVPAVA